MQNVCGIILLCCQVNISAYACTFQVLCLVAFIACVLKKPDLEEEGDTSDALNNAIAAHDEEITIKGHEFIDGMFTVLGRHLELKKDIFVSLVSKNNDSYAYCVNMCYACSYNILVLSRQLFAFSFFFFF